MNLEEIDARIESLTSEAARIQEEIASLKRIRRAKCGGLATAGRARPRRHPDERIWAAYDKHVAGKMLLRAHGAVKVTSHDPIRNLDSSLT